ncbi:MAG: PspA/IM30 family protein [Anaerolineae bacterium]|nr:PspA/IM30 family protein [Anaerolineae bacterium]
MPNSFFDKLNTLVRAHVNNIVDPIDENTSRSRRKALARQDIRRGLQDDVKTRRKRIEDALAYQDQLQAQVSKLYKEIQDYDAQADQAVSEGREEAARYAIRRMQQAQRQLEMTEADLREHQYLTQDLISQVNTMEGVIEQAQPEEASRQPANTEDDESVDNIGAQIVQQLDDTRQRLGDLISSYTRTVTNDFGDPEAAAREAAEARAKEEPNESRPVTHTVDSRKVDDDLSARLARLSKPPKDGEDS